MNWYKYSVLLIMHNLMHAHECNVAFGGTVFEHPYPTLPINGSARLQCNDDCSIRVFTTNWCMM